MLGNVKKIYELSIARLPDWTVVKPGRKGIFSSVGKNINTTLFIIISIVLG